MYDLAIRYTLDGVLKARNLLFDVVDTAGEGTRIVSSVKRQEMKPIRTIVRGFTSGVQWAMILYHHLSNIPFQLTSMVR